MRGIVFLLAIPLSCMLSVGVCPANPDISVYTGSCDATVMQALVHAVYDIEEVGFQLFPEFARFFERFLSNRADISPNLDVTKSFFAMIVVSIVIHLIPAFRTVW